MYRVLGIKLCVNQIHKACIYIEKGINCSQCINTFFF